MAKRSKSAQIHEAFCARFRSAYLAQYNAHAHQNVVHKAWEETVKPALDKTWPDYEKLSVSDTIKFVNTAVFVAMQNIDAEEAEADAEIQAAKAELQQAMAEHKAAREASAS
jgi:hypothetical protein